MYDFDESIAFNMRKCDNPLSVLVTAYFGDVGLVCFCFVRQGLAL